MLLLLLAVVLVACTNHKPTIFASFLLLPFGFLLDAKVTCSEKCQVYLRVLNFVGFHLITQTFIEFESLYIFCWVLVPSDSLAFLTVVQQATFLIAA